MINIQFPDGNVKQFESGVTPLQIAESISTGLARNILAAKFNDEEWDIARPVTADGSIQFFKWDDPEGKHAFWHTSAHLLAEALQELYIGIQFGIGPAIENGFYYDIDPGENTLTSADFDKIEKKMMELVARKEEVVRRDISKADALEFFGNGGQSLKCELISELEDGHITTYT
ncbi:MAG: TGS domain-containing protein, partial [Muribaculaceae bacterium]|nr:TGS domain-containing protein [Muribaculaceae bacterium]